MSPTQPKFFIGIDLGTTNSALAYSPIPTENDPPPSVQVLPILQPATEDTQIVSTLLPSFLWLPPQSDTWTVGALARSRQPQMPNRSIRSSKSWLAHTSADRRANIFPLGSHDIPSHLRLSPVSAATLLLQHLAKEWERQNPPHKFSDQNITITVPASFDPTAQQLTLEAAHAANYPPTTALLEEPQAAFCFWLAHNQTQLHKLLSLKPNPHILVIDIGGGTSDFSIFQITQKIHSLPNLRRIAISNHLLLGGDNLDLALAHELESRLCPNNQLPPTSFALLLERAREIKELSLDIPTDSPTDNPTHTVTIALPGSTLLTSTLQCQILQSEVRSLLLDGFFPIVGPRETPLRPTSPIREMGLPYARDPAITRHLAEFLRDAPPIDAILFTGGTTKPRAIRHRILECIRNWQNNDPIVLQNPSPDLAVAIGAVHYQLLHIHNQTPPQLAHLDSGSPFAYYIGLHDNRALCILPAGAPPGKEFLTQIPGLHARTNCPISLPIFRSNYLNSHPHASILPSTSSLTPLPPVHTILDSNVATPSQNPQDLPVSILARLLPTGLLELHLLPSTTNSQQQQKWKLNFSTRSSNPTLSLPPAAASSQLDSLAQHLISLLLSPPTKNQKLTANSLLETAERTLNSPRQKWPATLTRTLVDHWLQISPILQKLNPERQEAWWQIAGYLLRPGWGILGDDLRVESLAKAALLATPNHGGLRLQRYIAIRRIASALPRQSVTPLWNSLLSETKPNHSPHPELLLCLASLEAAPPESKSSLAQLLVSLLTQKTPPSSPPTLWRALGLTLSRILPHAGSESAAPISSVLHAWHSLQNQPIPQNLQQEAANAWLRAARLTGIRELDLPLPTRREINSLLQRWNIPPQRRQPLLEVIPIAAAELPSLIGEPPPPGLLLHTNSHPLQP